MIYSTTHITKNENDQEEVRVERSLRLLEAVRAIVKNRTFKINWRTTDTYVCIGTRYGMVAEKVQIWINKDTGHEVSDHEGWMILEIQIQTALNNLALKNK